MKERPILFSAPMVRAILEGRKTQTLRIIKPQPFKDSNGNACWKKTIFGQDTYKGPLFNKLLDYCPYGVAGDQLWVRETFQCDDYRYPDKAHVSDYLKAMYYKATNPRPYVDSEFTWRPSIHMPRWASRIDLLITGIRAERLNDISEADAFAEGIYQSASGEIWSGVQGFIGHQTAVSAYAELWEAINGSGSWAKNPWLWVVEFKQVTK